VLESPINCIVHACTDLCSQKESDSERYVVQTSDSDTLAVDALPDSRERRQYKVEKTEEIRHVHSDQLNDRLGGEQSERSDSCGLQDTSESFVGVEFGVESFIPCLFSQAVCSPLQKCWCIGLLQEEKPKELDEDSSDTGRPKDPPPRCFLGDKTPSDRSNGGSK